MANQNRCSSPDMFSRTSPLSTSGASINYFNWREKRQRLFIYWCFTHFIHGMIHSIRYSSQYLYFKDVMQVSNPDLLYGISVSFMGVTGVIFPLIISPYIDRTRDIKKAILIVNVLGIIGNLLYALPFHPIIPLIGQLIAGTTPAFGVIAMGEISRCYSPEKLTKRISALSLIYSVGTFTSIGLVFGFLYVDFNVGKWRINYADMPGLFLAVAFTVSLFLSFVLVSDVSKEFDLKLEERMKRSSCGSTPMSNISSPPMSQHNSSPTSRENSPPTSQLNSAPTSQNCSPHTSQRNSPAPENLRNSPAPENSKKSTNNNEENNKAKTETVQPFYFANYNKGKINDKETNRQNNFKNPYKSDMPDKSDNNLSFSFPTLQKHTYAKLEQQDSEDLEKHGARENACDAARKTIHFIWKIVRFKDTSVLMAITFMEAFIYSIIVTSLPVIASNYLNWGKVELAVLSMVNKFLSVIISGSIYFLTDYLHDFLLLIYGTLFSLLALLTLSVLDMLKENTEAVTVMLFIIAALSISGVPLVITSTRSMLAKLVPTEIQSLSEAVRMSVFEASFVPAGFLVPLITINLSVTALILLLLMLSVALIAIRQIKSLVELQEVDEYWQS